MRIYWVCDSLQSSPWLRQSLWLFSGLTTLSFRSESFFTPSFRTESSEWEICSFVWWDFSLRSKWRFVCFPSLRENFLVFEAISAMLEGLLRIASQWRFRCIRHCEEVPNWSNLYSRWRDCFAKPRNDVSVVSVIAKKSPTEAICIRVGGIASQSLAMTDEDSWDFSIIRMIFDMTFAVQKV